MAVGVIGQSGASAQGHVEGDFARRQESVTILCKYRVQFVYNDEISGVYHIYSEKFSRGINFDI